MRITWITEKNYHLIFEGFCKGCGHIISFGKHDFFIGIFFPESLFDFFKKAETYFEFHATFGKADKDEDTILEDMIIVSTITINLLLIVSVGDRLFDFDIVKYLIGDLWVITVCRIIRADVDDFVLGLFRYQSVNY